MCGAITVAMAMLLRDFGLYGILFMTVFSDLLVPVILNGQFSSLLCKILSSLLFSLFVRLQSGCTVRAHKALFHTIQICCGNVRVET
jgi:hypothetical protein